MDKIILLDCEGCQYYNSDTSLKAKKVINACNAPKNECIKPKVKAQKIK